MNRNESLARLLDDLVLQETVSPLPQILIVDNSPDSNAKEMVHAFSEVNQINITYLSEGNLGVSFARNRALEMASQMGSDLIFLDDDERAKPQWLSKLLETSGNFPTSIITGPVIPELNPLEAQWCPKHLCWQRPVHEDNALLNEPVGTGNIYIPLESIRQLQNFKLELNSGGEDTEFTKRWLDMGGTIRFSRNAEIVEPVTLTRQEPLSVRRRIEHSTFIWAGLNSSTFLQKFLLLARLFMYLGDGISQSIINSHKGDWFTHQRIYMAKFVGLSRYVFSLNFLRAK